MFFDIYERLEEEKNFGEGAQGDVFTVRRKDRKEGDSTIFAAKMFKKDFIYAFEKEIKALPMVKHPNCINIIEVYDGRHHEWAQEQPDKTIYIVYDYAGKGSLKNRMKMFEESGEVMTKKFFLNWALTMADCLRYLHDELLISHHDLHDGNWLVRNNDEIVLGDFGCSTVHQADEPEL